MFRACSEILEGIEWESRVRLLLVDILFIDSSTARDGLFIS